MAITKSELAAVVSDQLSSADNWMDSDLAAQQAKNLKYYNGEKFGNEKAGFSQVVTRDVLQIVEGIMPSLMKLFLSGDEVVQFDPQTSEDVEAAEQATDYLNYIFIRRMNGFELLYNWFKEALITKNSVIKTGWEEKETVSFDFFGSISQEEVDALKIDLEDDQTIDEVKEVETNFSIEKELEKAFLALGIVEEADKEAFKNAPEFDEVMAIAEEASKKFDVKISRRKTEGKPFAELIPIEEFRIKSRSKSIEDSDFTAHVTEKTIGELIEAGFSEKKLEMLGSTSKIDDSEVTNARFNDPSEEQTDNAKLKHERVLEVIDAYVTLFDVTDSRNKIFHVIQVKNTVLKHEEVTHVPFINISPIMMPNKFVGISMADLGTDIQEIRSQLMREVLNNAALTNSGRYQAVEGQVNLQDLIDNKIGGIVRTKAIGMVSRLDTPALSAGTFPLLQAMEEEREQRSGVSKMTQGLDSNALTSNTAATSVNQVMTAAQEKMLLIARVYAETGVKKLFRNLYELVRTHQNKDQQGYHLQQISQVLQQVKNSEAGYLISEKEVYNLAAKFIENAGFRDTESFIQNPNNEQVQKPEPQPDAEMIKAQGEAQKDAADAQLKQAQAQAIVLKGEKEQAEMALKTAELNLQRERFEWEKKVNAAELALEQSQERPIGIGTGK